MARTPRAVLMDLDNTLYAYDPCNEAGLDAAYAALNASAPLPRERFDALHTQARDAVHRRLSPQAACHHRLIFFKWMLDALPAPRAPAGLALSLYEAYTQAFLDRMRPHPDAQRVLRGIRERRMRLALVTNQVAEFQLRKLVRLGLDGVFDLVMTSEEAGVEKPLPGIFLLTLERLGVAARDAVMVGDHLVGDVQGAQALGIRAVHSVEYDPLTLPGIEPDHRIRTLSELLRLW